MTYTVYTHRVDGYEHIITKARKSVSKEEAQAIKAQKMANPKRVCNYVIVADSRVEEYEHKIAALNAPYYAWLTKKNAYVAEVKARRWEEVKAMKAKGYKVRDVLEYVNRDLDKIVYKPIDKAQ